MQPSDNRLVLYEPIPQSQDIAALEIALNLTMNYAKRAMESGKIVQWGQLSDLTLTDVRQTALYDKKPDDFIIPRALDAMVNHHIIDCLHEIREYLCFYNKCFSWFDKVTVSVMREFLEKIVWKPNGKIDHLHTAFNLVKSIRLEETAKFCVMCEFCMEEEIRNAWSEFRNSSFIKTCSLWQLPLLTMYWCCVMTGDLSQAFGFNDIDSVEKRLLLRLCQKSAHFPAVEYFFNRLDIDDRIRCGARLIQRKCSWTRFLISKYTEDEQYRLFFTSNNLVGILGALTRDISFEYLNDALKIWNHIKNLVNGDQYVKILNQMDIWGSNVNDELHEFSVEFWRATPQNLKQYMFQLKEDECIVPYENYPYYGELILRDDRIIIAILSDADLEYRKRFWHRHWESIVKLSQPFRLKEILNLCVSNDEMTAFKKDATSSPIIRKYLVKIIERGKFLVLNEFLKMFIDGGQREIDDAKIELFNETTLSEMHLAVVGVEETEESVAALIEFLRLIFGDDVKKEIKFRRQMILECIKYDDRYFFRNNIRKIIYVSERICEAAFLKRVKNEVLKKCQRLLSPKDYQNSNRNEWNEVLLWCFGDQQRVEEFKISCEDLAERAKERAKRRKRC